MNRAAVPLAVLPLSLFLLPAATAAMPALFAMEAETTGSGTIEAVLQGAWLEDSLWDVSELITASSLDGEMTLHQRIYDLYAAQVGVTPVNNTDSTMNLDDATIDQFRLGPEVRILVIGREATLRMTPDRTALTPNLLDFTFPRRASPGDPWRIPSAQTLQITAGNGSYAVTGNFELVVWDATFSIHNATTNRTIQTGTWDEAPSGLPSGGPVSRHIQREAVLRIQNGTLLLPGHSAFQVYVDQVLLELQSGELRAKAPSGVNPVDGQTIAAGTKLLALHAPLSTHLMGADENIGLAFLQPPREANVDGSIVVPPGSSNWWAWSLLAVVAVPVILAGAARVRRNHQARRLDALMRNRDLRAAGHLAQAIRRHHPRDQEALVAETIALVHGHGYSAARQLLTDAEWSEPLRPMRDYLRACVEVGLGHRKQAIGFLAACLRAAPELQAEAQANPLLHGLIAEARRIDG